MVLVGGLRIGKCKSDLGFIYYHFLRVFFVAELMPRGLLFFFYHKFFVSISYSLSRCDRDSQEKL
jgi:hypothetical protein